MPTSNRTTYRDETISYLMYHGGQQDDTWIITVLNYKTICFGLNRTVLLYNSLTDSANGREARAQVEVCQEFGIFPFFSKQWHLKLKDLHVTDE